MHTTSISERQRIAQKCKSIKEELECGLSSVVLLFGFSAIPTALSEFLGSQHFLCQRLNIITKRSTSG